MIVMAELSSGGGGQLGQVTVSEEWFGEAAGQDVFRYTMQNGRGMKVRILNYGGILQSVEFPGRSGHSANIVLGFSTLPEYIDYNPARNPANPKGASVYFGALIGRYAGPIASGRFGLKGATFEVPINSGSNAMHGGTVGFDQKVWMPTELSSGSTARLGLEYVSPAGEMGFPGTLDVVATYALDNDNRMTLSFRATSDAPTVVNLTNHTYWNLAGEGSGTIYGQLLHVNADAYTPLNCSEIPTNRTAPVAGTAFDFTSSTPIGTHIRDDNPQLLIGRGYDVNFVLNQTKPNSMILAARAVDPVSGRMLSVYTTEPGLQLYTGNLLEGNLVGTGGHVYRQSDGFALETQHFPDAPNHADFPSTELIPGETYNQRSEFELACVP